jgi:hypothetical protein
MPVMAPLNPCSLSVDEEKDLISSRYCKTISVWYFTANSGKQRKEEAGDDIGRDNRMSITGCYRATVRVKGPFTDTRSLS